MKFTGVALAPILLVLAGVFTLTRKGWRAWGRHVPVIPLVAAGVVLAVYAPYWSPAPPLSPERAATLGVPTWFQVLRPILIPPHFFKGLALQTAHAAIGHQGFLCGQWRTTGWWYYFPVALAVKLPLPWLALTAVGLLLWLMGLRRFSFPLAVPWLAAWLYLALAMAGTIDIGVRYVLPIIPLLAVGIASQFSLHGRRVQLGAWLGAGWLLLVTWHARPCFLEYFNEIAGGPSNGYQWLVDSNLDWGQDVKRLKHFLDEQAITNIDLAFLGPSRSIDYEGIAARRVTPGEAAGMRRGTLVVSATELMGPAWDWLRASHEPAARVGYTMFVYRLGDADTREHWEQMLRIDPHDARAHYNLGIVLERAGDAGGAIAHYEQAIRIKPDFARAQDKLALALEQTGKTEEAIVHYEQALRMEPDNAATQCNLGKALLQEGKFSDAIEQYEQALRLEPDDAEAHTDLGVALARTGRIEEAIHHFEQALQIKPDDAEAHTDLGVVLAGMGRIEEATNQFGQALQIKPDDAEAHYNLGNVFLQEGKFSDAIADFEQALRLKPNLAAVHYNLGTALAQVGRVSEAIEHFQQALRLKPDYHEALNGLAWLLATRDSAEGGDPIRAVALAQQACQLTDHRVASYLDTLAAAYAAAGRFSDATATAEKAIELARAGGQPRMAGQIESRLQLYRDGRAYRDDADVMKPLRAN